MGKLITGPYHTGFHIPDPMQLVLPHRFANGRFRSQLVRGDHVVWDSGFHPQVMTNAFFEAYLGGTFSRAQLLAWAAVGTGTADAAPGDTTITQHGVRAEAQSQESSASIAGNVITQRIQYRWAQGAITTPITEAALFAASSGGLTMVRSRLKDPLGVPTTIPVTAFDALYLTWEADSIVNLSDITSVVNYGGEAYNVTARPMYWTSDATAPPTNASNPFLAFSGANNPSQRLGFSSAQIYSTQTLGAVTAGPGGAGANASSSASAAYTAGSKALLISHTWSSAVGNALGGIGCASVYQPNTSAGYQLRFAKVSDGSKLPKDETLQFRLDLTLTYGT
jgi:hypothetical protein